MSHEKKLINSQLGKRKTSFKLQSDENKRKSMCKGSGISGLQFQPIQIQPMEGNNFQTPQSVLSSSNSIISSELSLENIKKTKIDEELKVSISPFGIQDTNYPELFPLGQKQYGCLYGNYYAILGSNNRTWYIPREAPSKSKVVFLNIQRKDNLVICSSINVEQLTSPIFIQLIWYNLQSKKIDRKITFFLNIEIVSDSARLRLSLVQMMKGDNQEEQSNLMNEDTAIVTIQQKNEDKKMNSFQMVLVNIKYIEFQNQKNAQREKMGLKSSKFSSATSFNFLQGFQISEIAFEFNQSEKLLQLFYNNGVIFVFTTLSMHQVSISLRNVPKNPKIWKRPLIYQLESAKLQLIQKIIAYELSLEKSTTQIPENVLVKSQKKQTQQLNSEIQVDRIQQSSPQASQDGNNFKNLLREQKIRITSCCFCLNKILVLASNNIVYEINLGRIINREDLIQIACQNSCHSFYGENLTVQEIHSIEGQNKNSSVLIAKVYSTNTQHFSVKFLNFKVNQRSIQFYSKVEEIEQHLIYQDIMLLKSRSSHKILVTKIKSIQGVRMSAFYQILIQKYENYGEHTHNSISNSLAVTQGQYQMNKVLKMNEEKIVIIELCLLNKFSVESMLVDDIKEKIMRKNHYIVDVYHLNFYNQMGDLWNSDTKQKNYLIKAHSLEGFIIVNNFSDNLDCVKLRKIIPWVANYEKMKTIKGKVYTEPVSLKIPLYSQPTMFAIDPFALKLLCSDKQKLQSFNILDEKLTKQVQIHLKDIKFLTFDDTGHYIVIYASNNVFVMTAINFDLVRKISLKGQIYQLKVCNKYIIMKWKEPLSNKVIVTVLSLFDSLLKDFLTFSVLSGQNQTLMYAYEHKLFLVEGEFLRAIHFNIEQRIFQFSQKRKQQKFQKLSKEYKTATKINENDEQIQSQGYCFNYIFQIKGRRMQEFKKLDAHEIGADSFLKLLPLQTKSQLSLQNEKNQKVVCLKIWENFIIIGTNLGKLTILTAKKCQRIIRVQQHLCQKVCTSDIQDIIISCNSFKLFHLVTKANSIMSFRFHVNQEKQYDPQIMQIKLENQVLAQMLLKNRLSNPFVNLSQQSRMKDFELRMQNIVGDLQQLNVKTKPQLKIQKMEMEQEIHRSIINSKIQEGNIRIKEKQKKQRLKEYYTKDAFETHVQKKQRQNQRYNNKVSEHYEVSNRLHQQIRKINEDNLKEKERLQEEQNKEYKEMVHMYESKLAQIQYKISELKTNNSMEELLNVIDKKMSEEELVIHKAELNEKLDTQLEKSYKFEKDVRWKIWNNKQNIALIKQKTEEIYHMCVNFKMANNHLNQMLKDKNQKNLQFEYFMMNQVEEYSRNMRKSNLENVIGSKNFLSSQIRSISWQIHNEEKKYRQIENYYQDIQKKIERMSEQLSTTNKELLMSKEQLNQKNDLRIKLKKKYDFLREKRFHKRQNDRKNLNDQKQKNNSNVSPNNKRKQKNQSSFAMRQYNLKQVDRLKKAVQVFKEKRDECKVHNDNQRMLKEVNYLREQFDHNVKKLKCLKKQLYDISKISKSKTLSSLEKAQVNHSENKKNQNHQSQTKDKLKLIRQKRSLSEQKKENLTNQSDCSIKLDNEKYQFQTKSSQKTKLKAKSLEIKQNSLKKKVQQKTQYSPKPKQTSQEKTHKLLKLVTLEKNKARKILKL